MVQHTDLQFVLKLLNVIVKQEKYKTPVEQLLQHFLL